MEGLKDVNSAADLLSLSPWTIRSYVRTGKLQPVRIGRRVLFEVRELERIVAEGRGEIRDEEEVIAREGSRN